MLPRPEDQLPFWKIAKFWSPEIQPPMSEDEVLDELEAAWWRGEIIGISALSRLQFLERVFEAHQRSSFDNIVFVTSNDGGPPVGTPQAEGGVLVVIDPRPEISVPSETKNWTEESCAGAFATLAESPSRKHLPILQFSLHFIELTREEFFDWVEMRDFDVPKFWRRGRMNK
jgi:hypothetical protein